MIIGTSEPSDTGAFRQIAFFRRLSAGYPQVTGPGLVSMVVEKGRPALPLRPRATYGVGVLLNRAFAYTDSELEKLASDALGAPQKVLPRYLLDKIDCLLGDPRPAPRRSRFASPEQAKALPMPSKNGVGLYEQDGFTPVSSERSQDDHSHAIARCELGSADLAACDDQLLAQKAFSATSWCLGRVRSSAVVAASMELGRNHSRNVCSGVR